MGHGGYGKRNVADGRRNKNLGVVDRKAAKPVSIKNQKKPKSVSLKNHIRSTERMLRKTLPVEVREAQEKKLEDLKKQQDTQARLAVERKIFIRGRKAKFSERRKVERGIRRLEKFQRTSSDHTREADITDQLNKLKEDLEYVRFFPKTENYVPLFTGGDKGKIIDLRNKLRKQIKANIVAAAASGKDLEETGSEDDGVADMSDDDFFMNGSSSDEEDADDEWTDKSTREQASSASGKVTSGMSSDDKNQKQVSARALMPPPRPSKYSLKNDSRAQKRTGYSRTSPHRERVEQRIQPRAQQPTFSNRSLSNTPYSRNGSSSRIRESSSARPSHSSNLSSNISSNSDAHKPRRKRRPKKKKQQS